jgi:hypothetical protein
MLSKAVRQVIVWQFKANNALQLMPSVLSEWQVIVGMERQSTVIAGRFRNSSREMACNVLIPATWHVSGPRIASAQRLPILDAGSFRSDATLRTSPSLMPLDRMSTHPDDV